MDINYINLIDETRKVLDMNKLPYICVSYKDKNVFGFAKIAIKRKKKRRRELDLLIDS